MNTNLNAYDPSKPKCRNCRFWYKWSTSKHTGSCVCADRHASAKNDRHHGDPVCKHFELKERFRR